ncbi:carbonic anhydrase family protein [Ulvibacter litoralis]|uniref:Carbonic anhydrase n=1 Tax=Ulvibacter litoralis TaxID=227084 RepID=A0A1G7DH34_9FLAO|nr:carbonic anhydrase family protein [Ulvibacter litoralis]GHC43479.1 carbonic anhydrase [Ulvibacter litoralis]SDE50817.1 carbonic anhydrase [Ulvibacter litoralis]
MKAHTKETQLTMTPEKALAFLKEGNLRFQNNLKANRNLLQQVDETSEGQFPFATILSCIDSRVSAELVFDQGLGDIFSVRIAGNIVNEDILGSIEFACKLAGSKIVLVLGHTSCGAVKGACDKAEMGNLTTLLSKIKPAVEGVKEPQDESLRTSKNLEFVDDVAELNVHHAIDQIRKQSSLLETMEKENQIQIYGGMYNVTNGEVVFFNK